MTALEYMQKRVEKNKRNYERERDRGAPQEVLDNIKLKIEYYGAAVSALKKVEDTCYGGRTMSKRLIDANALIAELQRRSFLPALVREVIGRMPTVEAVEVVHGKWSVILDDDDNEVMLCSICGEEFYDGDNDTVDHFHNYCPHCGAKMDGGKEI